MTIPSFAVMFLGENLAAILTLFDHGLKFDIVQKEKDKPGIPSQLRLALDHAHLEVIQRHTELNESKNQRASKLSNNGNPGNMINVLCFWYFSIFLDAVGISVTIHNIFSPILIHSIFAARECVQMCVRVFRVCVCVTVRPFHAIMVQWISFL